MGIVLIGLDYSTVPATSISSSCESVKKAVDQKAMARSILSSVVESALQTDKRIIPKTVIIATTLTKR